MASAVDPTRVDEVLVAVRALTDVHNQRDWHGMRALLADDFCFSDHRPTSFDTEEGLDGWIRLLQVAIDLVPDRTIDVVDVVPDAPPGLMHVKASGTDEFESPVEWDFYAIWGLHGGLINRLEVYTLEQLDEALVRANALSAE